MRVTNSMYLVQALWPLDGDLISDRRRNQADRGLLRRRAVPLAVEVHLPAELTVPLRILARHVIDGSGRARVYRRPLPAVGQSQQLLPPLRIRRRRERRRLPFGEGFAGGFEEDDEEDEEGNEEAGGDEIDEPPPPGVTLRHFGLKTNLIGRSRIGFRSVPVQDRTSYTVRSSDSTFRIGSEGTDQILFDGHRRSRT